MERAEWNPAKGIYKLTLKNPHTGERWEDWSHVLVNASGNLNKWKWPDIDGLHDFAGPKMHSARWDDSINFTGKTVGVIGTGSTAIQIVPQLQKKGGKLKLFMRSPTWISPPFGGQTLREEVKGGDEGDVSSRQYYFSEKEMKHFEDDPNIHLGFRRKIEAEINLLFPFYTKGSDLQKAMHKVMLDEMLRRIGPGHEELKVSTMCRWFGTC